MEKKQFSKKRICAFLLILVLIANMFSPYGVLLNTSYAADLPDGTPYFELSIQEVDDTISEDEWTDATWYYYYDYYQGNVDSAEDYTGSRVVFIDLAIKGSDKVNAGDINLVYDSTKLIPTHESYSGSGRNKIYFLEDATEFENPNSKNNFDFATMGWDTPVKATIDTSSSTIRVAGAAAGGTYVSEGDIVCSFMFKLADGVTLDDLTTDVFTLAPASALNSGLKIAYYPDGAVSSVEGEDYLKFNGFAESGAKTVSSVTLESNLSKTKYYVGEDIDFSGASLKITYSDGSDETITDIAAAIQNGTLSLNSTTADATKKVTVTVENKNCDILYNIATGIAVETNPTDTTYDHGDLLNFAGGSIKVIYDNGDEESIDMTTGISSGKLTVDKTTADVNDPKVTFTYVDGTSTVDVNLTVNDPIDSIVITTLPTDLDYDHGDTISVAGGVIKAVKRSGAEITGISMSDSNVTISATTADINACTNTWANGSLTAGNQTITVTYAQKTTTYEIVVNDTVQSIAVKTQPTAKNKYGTPSGSLNYDGATIEVTTASNNNFDVQVLTAMVDVTSYNANTLSTQNLPVTYAGQTTTSGNGINITLLDYIDGITVTAPSNLSSNYNEELDLSGITYVKNYASGASSNSIAVTSDMVSGYNKTPASTNFNSNHECVETITVTLSTADDADIDEVPATDTFNVTVKDTVTGIRVSQRPNVTTYDYGGTFSANGGRIEVTYASGATLNNSVSMTEPSVSITETDGSAIDMTPDASSFVNGNVVKTLKVTYTANGNSFDTTTDITILDVLDTIAIDTNPTTVFNHGDTFDVGSGTLKVKYKSGVEQIVNLDDAVITETVSGTSVNMSPAANEYNSNNNLTKNLTATYEVRGVSKQVGYTITIINDVRSIAMHGTTHKVLYNVNDLLDRSVGEIVVHRATGTDEVLPLSDSRVAVTGFDSSAEVASLPLTVTFTENGNSATTTYNVEVKDMVTSVTMGDLPNKTDYKYNEPLDLTGATINVVKGSGPDTITITDDMVSGYDPTILGDQTIIVTYGGFTTSFVVTVKDYVTGITLNPANVTGELNDTLADLISANNIQYTVTYAKAGAQTAQTLPQSMVAAGYNPTSTAAQTLTVTYVDNDTESYTNGQSFTADLSVALSNVVTGVTITAPTKDTYNHAETLDLTGGVITLTYADGTTSTVDIASATITEDDGVTAPNMAPAASEFVSGTTMTKTLKIKYTTANNVTGTVDYPITIVNDVRSIAMEGTSHKVLYNVGETLDTSVGQIKVTRAVGTPETVALSDSRVAVTGFDSSAEVASLPLTVTFTENGNSATTTYNVEVKDMVTSVTMGDLPTKTNYKYNEPLDLTGATINVVRGSGSVNIPVDASMVSGYNPTTLGDQTITVTYGGLTTTFTVNVKDYVTGITLNPASVTGIYGVTLADLLSNNNVQYTVNYAKAGAQTAQTVTVGMVGAGYDATLTTPQTLIVTYTDNDANSFTNGDSFTANLGVTLSNVVTGVTITPPTKTTYNHAETLDLTGGVITLTYADGTTSTVDIASATITEDDGVTAPNMAPAISEFVSGTTMTKTLKIKYTTANNVTGTVDYPITIVNDVRSIAMEGTSHKVLYNVGETLDTSVGQIKVTRAVGTPETVALSDSRVAVTGFDSSAEVTSLPLTVTFTENGNSATTTYNVEVKDMVTSVTMGDLPNKTVYKYNESLDLTGATINVVRGSGSATIPVTDDMVTGYDPTTLGDQTITVTYGGLTTSFTVNVKDYVTGITLNPANIAGELNDTLAALLTSNNVQYTVTYAKAGAQTAQAVVESMVAAGYNPTATAAQTLTVTYVDNDANSDTNGQSFTADLTVALSNVVTGVTITAPTKDTYNHAETLDLTGGTITLTYADGTTSTVDMSSATITEDDGVTTPNMAPAISDFAADNTMTKTLVIKYTTANNVTGSVNYPITIVNDVRSIAMHGTTHKVLYNVGDALDTSVGEIEVTRAVGSAEILPLSDSRVAVTGFDSSAEVTSLPLTVTFTENGNSADTTYNVEVKDMVTSLTMGDLPTKTNYKYNEPLDLTGATINVVRGSGSATIPVTDDMVSGYDPTILGDQTITVTYGGLTTTFTVNVKDYVTGITLNPANIAGELNDTLAALLTSNNVQYTVTYAKAGAQTAQALPESMVAAGYNPTATAAQTLTVTYVDNDANSFTNGQSFTADLTVALSNVVTGVTITPPTKTTYNHAETLDLTGGTITLTYADGTTSTVDMSSATITEDDGVTAPNMAPTASEFGSGTTMTKTLKIKYTTPNNVTGSVNYPITIVNDVRSIAMHGTAHKVLYNVGDALDTSVGEIEVTRAVGSAEILPLSDSRVAVTGFDSSAEVASLPLTVTFTENGIPATTTYNVEVRDMVTSLTMGDLPNKTVYKYNEALDLTGATINVVRGSGSAIIPVTSDMVTGYDPTTLGDQTITVTYGGLTTSFIVTVKDYVTGITLNPANIAGELNDTLAALLTSNNVQYTVTYAKAGAQIAQALPESMVAAGYNPTATAAQTLTVTYIDNDANSFTNGQSFTADLTVALSNVVTGVTITPPTKTTYNHAETLDLTGGTITLTYADGTTSTIDMSSATITEADGVTAPNMAPTASEFGTGTTMTKTLKIKYTTANNVTGSVNYPITIVNDVRSIAMHGTTHKVLYNVGDALDTSVGEIEVTRAVGSAEVLPLSDSRVAVTGFDSSAEVASLPLTVTFTENGIPATTTYNVEVKDMVTSLTMGDLPNKTVYKYNEPLDLTGATINVVRGSGSATIPVTSDMVSGYNPAILGDQTITVTYGGLTTSFTVNVKDYVTGITLNPTNVTGELNAILADLLTNNNVQYTVTYAKAGAQTAQAVTDGMITSTYDPTTTAPQTLTVTYVDSDANSDTNGQLFTADLGVVLSNAVQSVEIVLPTNTSFNHGDNLDLTGGKVIVTYQDTTIQNIPLDLSMITEVSTGNAVNMSPAASEYNAAGQVTKTLKITYSQGGQSDTETYDITISDYVLDVLFTPPTKDTYEYSTSGTLDLTGGSVQKVMASGASTTPVPLTDSSVIVGSFNPTQIGAQTITVEYEGVTNNFGVVVENNVQSIVMDTTPKTQYLHGENLDVSGGTIIATRSNGDTEVVTLNTNMVTGFDSSIIGPQTLTVTYEGKTTTYDVEVKDYATGITINKPTKTVYNIGELIDLTNGQVKLTMAGGTATTPVAMTDSQVTISGFDTSSVGAKTITVTYQGFSATFSITVVDELSDVVINSLPDKTDYLYGEELDLTGATLKAKKDSGASEIINITKDMVSGYNPNKLGEQKITVTYEGFTQEFIVKVSDYVSRLEIIAPEKSDYEYGQDLDLAKGKVSIIMASGAKTDTADMTASMVSGYDKTKEGTQTITVKYKGLEGNFQVKVTDKVKGISMNTEPNKTVYKKGEKLDVTGATITVVKSSGIDTVKVTKDMLSGYNANKTGSQIITVNYSGFTTKFIVMVEGTAVAPTTPVKPSVPSKPNVDDDVTTEIPEEDIPVVEEPEIPEEPVEKPEEDKGNVMGETDIKDEKDDNKDSFDWDIVKVVAAMASGLALLIFLIAVFFKRNVKVYVFEDGEFVFGGADKITKKDAELNIDKFLDKETYPNVVKVRLSKSISKKLDKKDIQIKHRGNKLVHKVQYNDESYEFILE